MITAWLAGALREAYGLAVESASRVHGGVDRSAQVWRVTTSDGPYAVKLRALDGDGRRAEAGLAVTARLAADGVTGVPAPLRTTDGALSARAEGWLVAVLPWAGSTSAWGAGQVGRGLSPAQWRAYGAVLGALHALTPAARLAAALARTDLGGRGIASERRTDRLACGPPADDLARDAAATWQDLAPQRAALVRLAARLDAGPWPAVVCHGDPHLGNVVVADAADAAVATVTVVDWDDVMLAPVEWDLMHVVGGVLADPLVSAEQQHWWFAGHGPVDVDPGRLRACRAARALEDLADFAAEALDSGLPVEQRETALRIVRGLATGGGLVRLALDG